MFRFRSFEFLTDESFLPSLSHLFCSAVGCCCCRGEIQMYGVSQVQQTVVQFTYSFPLLCVSDMAAGVSADLYVCLVILTLHFKTEAGT